MTPAFSGHPVVQSPISTVTGSHVTTSHGNITSANILAIKTRAAIKEAYHLFLPGGNHTCLAGTDTSSLGPVTAALFIVAIIVSTSSGMQVKGAEMQGPVIPPGITNAN